MMPFGVTRNPTEFMNMMNDLLSDYLGQFVPVFVDDILEYYQSIQKHVEHLEKVLQKLRDYRFFAEASKSSFYWTTVEFSGHEVSADGMTSMEIELKKKQCVIAMGPIFFPWIVGIPEVRQLF